MILPILFSVAYLGFGQDIPSEVRYKKAPEEVNHLAKARIENALSSTSDFPSDFFGDVFVVGPTLWKVLRPLSDRMLIDAKPVVLVISGQSPITAEGKAIRTDDEKKAFWRLFKSQFKDVAKAEIRKARAEEISYFWATIPFDIEEPFYVIETKNDRLIANFQSKDGKPLLFWIDVVGDFEKLRSPK